MKIEILNTGTELLLGTTLNTHGAWLGLRLSKAGLRVQRQTTVPDGVAIEEALAECVQRCDCLIVTGGLGPTSDDLSREATAKALGLEMIEDEFALRLLTDFFDKRGRTMAPSNRKQAQAFVGCDVLPNLNGTAPGLYIPPRLSKVNCAVFLLPGPPNELHPLFFDEVLPRLRALSGIEENDQMLELKFVGVGESDMQEQIDAQLDTIPNLEVGYCARLGEVDLRLIGDPAALAAGRALAEAHYLPDLVSDDGSSLEEVIIRRMTEKNLRLATAESCTGGLIANRLTNVPGASAIYTHGLVTYANEAKRDLLGVSQHDLDTHGAVSEPVARQMADGALLVSGADFALVTTGIAGPDGGSEDKPLGTVFIGLAQRGAETLVFRELHPRNRLDFKQIVSQRALDHLRRALPH